jgi:diguanylate cyclase (GGDEF)-like protein
MKWRFSGCWAQGDSSGADRCLCATTATATDRTRIHPWSHLACLAFADVDGLKRINDTHGHQAGDAILISMADALRSALRTPDLIARVSGDEFAALAIDADERDEELLIDRIRCAVEDRNHRLVLPVGVSLSIGVAFRPPRSGVSLTDLMDRADRSMFESKRERGS